MENDELLEKLNNCLSKINNAFLLAKLTLVKSEEVQNIKQEINLVLQSYKSSFGEVEFREIDKEIGGVKNLPKSGIWLNTEALEKDLRGLYSLLQKLIIAKGGCQEINFVDVPELESTRSVAVSQAIKDTKVLLKDSPISAVDRIHTVLHGYLKEILKERNIEYVKDATLNQLFKNLKEKDSKLNIENENIKQIFNSMANILDKLSLIRNNESLAHANDNLLSIDESLLFINSANTILCYLNSKFKK